MADIKTESYEIFKKNDSIEEDKAYVKDRDMTLVGENKVMERFSTKDYVGHYECDGVNCNCSWFMKFKICRHNSSVSKN